MQRTCATRAAQGTFSMPCIVTVAAHAANASRSAALAQRHKEQIMDCRKCGSPMYYPSPSKLCPQCEGEELDKWIAEQESRPTPRAVDGGQAGENNGQVALPTASNANR